MRIIGGVVILILFILWILIKRDISEITKNISHVGAGTNSIHQKNIKNNNNNESIFFQGVEKLHIQQEMGGQLLQEIRKQIVGLDGFLHTLCVSLLIPGGHVLIEGVPGLAKTKTISALAKAVTLDFKRIQFTPDMLPGDITGIDVFRGSTKQFEFVEGPLFSNMILADEINRTTPKVQSALLEAMEEQQVTIGHTSYSLPKPFFVLATQNPIEQEGTYPLPEAQVDRFLMKILVGYPSTEQEQAMLSLIEKKTQEILPVLDAEKLLAYQQAVSEVTLSIEIKNYIVRLVEITRVSPYFQYGASPRASLALMRVAKAVAWLQGRNYVMYTDVQMMCLLVLRHRVALKYEYIAQGRNIDEVLVEVIEGISTNI